MTTNSNQQSKVSILLPVFNAERYLVSTLESVLTQSHTNWELVVVDNCSQDRTEEIVREFASRDKRIKFWRNSQNVGFARNYNRCIELSTGDYLQLLGADDLLEPMCVEKLATVLDTQSSAVLVTSQRTLIDADSRPFGVIRAFETSRLIPTKEAIEKILSSLSNWIVAPVMYRASSKRSGFDPSLRMYADLDYWMQVLQDGDAFYLDEMLFRCRVHLGSETSRMSLNFETFIDIIRMVDKYREMIVSQGEAGDGKPLEEIIGERLLADFRHEYLCQGDRFDAILRPYTKLGTTEPENPEQLRADFYDLRRLFFYALLHASKLPALIALNEQRFSLKEKLTEAIACHDHAVHERDKASEEVRKLSLELQSSALEQDGLKREVDKLRQEILIARQETDASKKEVSRIQDLLSASQLELARLLSSDSWKLTAPLREIRKIVRQESAAK